MSRKLRLDGPILHRSDDNVRSYRVEDDGRNTRPQDRIRYVPLGRVYPSPNQTRLVRTPDEDALLEEDIATHGLTHPPLLRPHPTLPDAYEIVAGHRRAAAMRRLAERGVGYGVLRGTGPAEAMLMPCVVEVLDDSAAHAKTVNENLVRQDISAWEQCVALARRQDMMAAAGLRSTGRHVAADVGRIYDTIAPYLKVAKALTPDVLEAAGLVTENRPNHDTLAQLPLEALRRIAQAPDDQRATRLRAEVSSQRRKSNRRHTDGAGRGSTAEKPYDGVESPRGRPLQINTRKPLGELTPDRAQELLARIVQAAVVLHEVAYPGEAIRYLDFESRHVVFLAAIDEMTPEDTRPVQRILSSLLGQVREKAGGLS